MQKPKMAPFTPIFDAAVKGLDGDRTAAHAYGVVWRYDKLNDGVCRIALKTWADIMGVNEKTVRRKIEFLIGKGWIEDLTPDAKGIPHSYVTKVKIEIVPFAILVKGPEIDPGLNVQGQENPGHDVQPNGLNVQATPDTMPNKDTLIQTLKDIEREHGIEISEALECIAGIDSRVVLELPISSSLLGRARAKIAIDNNAARQAAGEFDLSWLPEYLHPLGVAFCDAWQEPFENERAFWVEGLIKLYEKEIPAKLIRPVITKMMRDGTTIKSPASIVTNAVSMKMQARYAEQEKAASSTQRAAKIVR